MIKKSLVLAWLAAGLLNSGQILGGSQVEVYPRNTHSVVSQVYQVEADGQSVFTEKFKDVNLAQFSFSGKVQVAVRGSSPIKEFSISPRSAKIAAKADGPSLRFEVDRPRQLVVTINGGERLFLFADPIDREAPLPGRAGVRDVREFGVDSTGQRVDTARLQQAIDQVAAARGTLYFGPGVYLTGTLTLKSNLTVYLAGGALLLGSARAEDYPREKLLAETTIKNDLEPWLTPGTDISDCRMILIDHARNIRIAGPGAIDGQGKLLMDAGIRPLLFLIRNSSQITFEGVSLRDPSMYNTLLLGSDHITYRGVKVLNDQKVPNTDGIDPDSTQDVLVERSFFYCGDDAISVKTSGAHFILQNSERHIYRDCVFLSTTSAAKLGNETFADFRDILFENCDVVESTRAFTLSTMDGGRFENIRFVGIRVESLTTKNRPAGQCIDLLFHLRERKVKDRPGFGRMGWIHNILVKDYSVEAVCANPSRLTGFSEDHDVRGVRFENYSLNGRVCLSAADAKVTIGPFVSDVSFAASPAGNASK